jgi:hypothetical protein
MPVIQCDIRDGCSDGHKRARRLAFSAARGIVNADSLRGARRTSDLIAMNSPAARLSPVLALLLLAGAPALTACQTDSTATSAAQAAPAEPLTHQEAALQCWMSTEKGRKDLPLDQRADIVTQCIKDKMNPGQAPAAAAPKPPKSDSPKSDSPKSKT